MRRISKVALKTVVGCVVAVLVTWATNAIYSSYRTRANHFADLEATVQSLKAQAHPKWRVRKGRFSISTTDRATGTNRTDFRLVYGTNDVQKFEDHIWKETGHIVAAWVSDWSPRSEMGKFEQFSLFSSGDRSKFEVIAKAHPNESVAMEFTMTFIVE
jgi:hypothetical protein